MVTQAQIDEIVRILVSECRPEKIILFGSYAQGTAQEDSDLDLAIVKETDLPHHKRSREFQKALRAGGRRWFFGMDILVLTPQEIETYRDSRASIIHEIVQQAKHFMNPDSPQDWFLKADRDLAYTGYAAQCDGLSRFDLLPMPASSGKVFESLAFTLWTAGEKDSRSGRIVRFNIPF